MSKDKETIDKAFSKTLYGKTIDMIIIDDPLFQDSEQNERLKEIRIAELEYQNEKMNEQISRLKKQKSARLTEIKSVTNSCLVWKSLAKKAIALSNAQTIEIYYLKQNS